MLEADCEVMTTIIYQYPRSLLTVFPEHMQIDQLITRVSVNGRDWKIVESQDRRSEGLSIPKAGGAWLGVDQ